MRTKLTGPRRTKPQVNGAPLTPLKSPPAQDVRSPGQPRDLTDEDRYDLKLFLEATDKPFSVKTVPITKKRKRTSTPLPTQTDLWEDRLSVQYEIIPANNWESLRKYKKFTVGTESIAVGECILVKHDSKEDAKIDIAAQWKAKVLEVRALDPEHVYIRVAWLNRPEDLDSGREAWHGKNELIPTNQLDIIDAMTVNGRLDLYHWEEADDDSPMPGTEEYFWRQTLDFANTKKLSDLRLLCTDKAPQNPDEMILQCGNPECRKWVHVRCIAEDAVQRASEGVDRRKSTGKSAGKAKKRKSKSLSLSPTPPALAAAKSDATSVKAEVFIKDLPDGPDATPSEATKVVVTMGDGEQRDEDVHCLFCQTAIE